MPFSTGNFSFYSSLKMGMIELVTMINVICMFVNNFLHLHNNKLKEVIQNALPLLYTCFTNILHKTLLIVFINRQNTDIL